MPSSRQAQITRRAISPRLAIRIFLNIAIGVNEGCGLDREQPLAVLDRLAVLDVHAHDLAFVLRRDLVHELHRFDDAEHLILLDAIADVDERRRARLGRSVERADDRRLHDRELQGRLVERGGRGASAGAAGAGRPGRAHLPRGGVASWNRRARPARRPYSFCAPGASTLHAPARTRTGRAVASAPESARCRRTPITLRWPSAPRTPRRSRGHHLRSARRRSHRRTRPARW